MKTIWKFPFETTDRFTLDMPEGAQILSVQTQMEQPCMWALVRTDAPKAKRTFAVHGTGHPVPTVGIFLGTYQLHGGALIFHLFEILRLGLAAGWAAE